MKTTTNHPSSPEDDESYEHSLPGGEGGVQINTSGEFASYRRKVREWEEGCCLWRVIYFIWKRILFPLEPVWQGLVIITFTNVLSFTGKKINLDDQMAFLYAETAGIMTMVVLLSVWWFTYQYGVFTDEASRRHVRNEHHGMIIAGYLFNLVLLSVAIAFFVKIASACAAVDPTHPCNVHDVFLSPRGPS
jgi:hypothetical protein